MMWHNILAVFRFELLRTLTLSRIGVWIFLTAFPVFIISIVKYNEESFESPTFDGSRGRRTVQLTVPLGNGDFVSIDGRRRGPNYVARVTTVVEGERRTVDNLLVPGDLMRYDNRNPRQFMAAVLTLISLQAKSIRERAPAEEMESMPHVPDTDWGWMLFALIPEVITLFGLLLWITPVVQAELEGRTWIYLAVRPRGRASTLLGKYLTAITWTALSGWVSVTLCVWVAQPEEAWRLWATLIALVSFACLAYGALYSLIGVFLHRRAMVIAVAYTLVSEFVVAFVPAVINQFTVQYRLRNLLVDFMDWRSYYSKEAIGVLLGEQPLWLHVLVLLAATVALLVVAVQVIQHKEYATADDV